MTTYTEGAHDCAFILSEASGSRSRENGTLIMGQDLEAGTILAASGAKLTGSLTGANAVGILLYKTDATDADVRVSYLARDAEVNLKLLALELSTDGDAPTATAALALLGIVTRNEGEDAALA